MPAHLPVKKINFMSALRAQASAARKGFDSNGVADELARLLHEASECQPKIPINASLFRIRVPKKPSAGSQVAQAQYAENLERLRQIMRLSKYFHRKVKRTQHGNFIM